MNQTIKYLAGIFIILIIAGYFMIDFSKGKKITQLSGEEDVQEIVIGMKNYNYYPNTVKVKVSQPVRITLDESVIGCFRDFTIRDFGIHEYLKTPSDSIEFTPTKKGKYVFACSMGMGTGTLIVE